MAHIYISPLSDVSIEPYFNKLKCNFNKKKIPAL